MDPRKKACPNERCVNFRNKKFNAGTNYCPTCGTKLVYVCKSRYCFQPLEQNRLNYLEEVYCKRHKYQREQLKKKASNTVKKVAETIGPLVIEACKDINKKANDNKKVKYNKKKDNKKVIKKVK